MKTDSPDPSLIGGRYRQWLWPGLVFLVAGGLGLRVYFQRVDLVLDDRMTPAELALALDTPRGQKAMDRMIERLAAEDEPLGRRAWSAVRRILPGKIQALDDEVPASEELLATLAILDKTPPEFKLRYVPDFVQMLDHPRNGFVAARELKALRNHTNLGAILIEYLQTEQGYDPAALHFALDLMPSDPRVYQVLAGWVANTPANPGAQITGVQLIGRYFSSHPEARALLQQAALSPHPMVSAEAARALSTLAPVQIRVPGSGQ